jgi:hypothetical protein
LLAQSRNTVLAWNSTESMPFASLKIWSCLLGVQWKNCRSIRIFAKEKRRSSSIPDVWVRELRQKNPHLQIFQLLQQVAFCCCCCSTCFSPHSRQASSASCLGFWTEVPAHCNNFFCGNRNFSQREE